MTAFADYIDLRTAVIEHVGTPDIADVCPRLLRLAEAEFNRELRLRQQVTTVTLTFASGVAALPTDFAMMIGVFDGNGCEYLQQTSPAIQGSGGAWYTIEGDSIVAPNITGELSVKYYAQIPPLSTTNLTSNWLLAKYPTVYLYGLGLEAAKYLKDSDLASATAGLFVDALSAARADDNSSRFARARVRVAGPTP